jgi:hypothetical protein
VPSFTARVTSSLVVRCGATRCRYAGIHLSITSPTARKVRLVLRARRDGRWEKLATNTLQVHIGTTQRRLAGRLHGALLPSRRAQILVQTRTGKRWHTRKTLILTVRRTR